jgi:hypothetical protein
MSSGQFKIRFKKGAEHDESSDKPELEEIQESKYTGNHNYLFNLPHDANGCQALPKLPHREKVEMFLSHKMIDEEFLADKFHSMIQNLYTSIAQKDVEGISSLTEARFADKIKQTIDGNLKRGLEIEFKNDAKPHFERSEDDKSYIFDKMFEKGVYFNRDQNDSNIHYFLNNELTNKGVRYYYHKYFTGLNHHYYFRPNESGEIKEQAEDQYKFKYIMDERNRSIVLRMYGVIRNVGRFVNSNSSSEIYPKSYSGNHIVIFENQIKEPPSISLTNPNVDRWINHHKIDHGNWRISDIDNYMRGNTFFNKILDQAEFKQFMAQSKEPQIPGETYSVQDRK